MAVTLVRSSGEERVFSPAESISSSIECDLMIDSLQRELQLIRSQLEDIVLSKMNSKPKRDHSEVTSTVSLGSNSSSSNTLSSGCQSSISAMSGWGGTSKGHNGASKGHNGRKGRPSDMDLLNAGRKMSISEQKRYINLVTEREKERAVIRERYLKLMEQYIEEQLVGLQKQSKILEKRLERRVAREKAATIPPKPIHTRSYLSSEKPVQHYQSAYYKAAVEEYTTNKRMMQEKPTGTLKSKELYKRLKLKKIPKREDTPPISFGGRWRWKAELIEEEEPHEPMYSWAVSKIRGVGMDPKEIRNAVNPQFEENFPRLRPLDEIFGPRPIINDEEGQVEYEAKMNKIQSNLRKVKHMYNMSRQHQMASAGFRSYIESSREGTSMRSTTSHLPPISTTMSFDSLYPTDDEPVVLPVISQSSLSPQIASLPPICSSPPLLSYEEAFEYSPVVVVPIQKSTMWKNYNK